MQLEDLSKPFSTAELDMVVGMQSLTTKETEWYIQEDLRRKLMCFQVHLIRA